MASTVMWCAAYRVAPDMPRASKTPSPKSMKPMWLTSRNDRSRLMSFWAIAPSAPTSIVATANHSINDHGWSCGNSSDWVRSMA